jgi:predicted phosphodiesterase
VSKLEDELAAAAATSGPVDKRDPDFAALEDAAAKLHAKGVDFRVEHGAVVTPKGASNRNRSLDIDLGKEQFRFAVLSDTHGGSKFEQLTALRSFYRVADDREVDFFIHAGDLTQGPDRMHRDQYLGVHAHGSDQQVDYVVATYPQSERGVPTYIITGNHDDSFLVEGGTNVVRQVAGRRPDFAYVGQDAAYLTIGGLRTYVIHPDGGGSYAKSYKPQKISESLPLDPPLAMVFIGHYHNRGQFRQKDTEVLMLACFQSQYSWLARKGLHPDIGAYVIDVWLDDNGRPARTVTEYVAYQGLEDDWDHEVSAEVSKGWSPKGMRT